MLLNELLMLTSTMWNGWEGKSRIVLIVESIHSLPHNMAGPLDNFVCVPTSQAEPPQTHRISGLAFQLIFLLIL